MHIPVLLQSIVEGLKPQEGETFIDGTVNRGGHAKILASYLGKTGRLIGIDQDQTALSEAKENLKGLACRVDLVQGNFREMSKLADQVGIDKANGILLDIGFSSDQIAASGRGFSFLTDEPLIMTFADKKNIAGNSSTGPTFIARDIVNDWDENNLADIIYAYGEETFARKIAAKIVEARQIQPIETTWQLVEVIRQAVPSWYTKKRIHFATKTFQAIRMTVNDELGSLKDGLASAWQILAKDGRLGVISFHSLEARLIKTFMKEKELAGEGIMTPKKAIKASRQEILSNPRSRSAQLRIITKK